MRVFLEISVRLKLTVPLAAGAIGLAINSLPVMAGDGAMPIGEPAAAVAIEALPQSDAPLAAKVEAPIPTAAPDTTAASSAPAVEVAPVAVIAPSIKSDAPLAAKVEAPILTAAPDTTAASSAPAVEVAPVAVIAPSIESDAPLAAKVEAPIPPAAPDTTAASSAPAVEVAPVAVIAPSIESDAPLAAKVEAPIPPAAPDTTVASCAPAVEAAPTAVTTAAPPAAPAASKTLQLSWARAEAEIPLPRAAPQRTIHEIPAQASTSERKGSQRLAAVMDEPGPRYMSDGRRRDPSITFTHEGFINGFLQRNFSVPSGRTYYPADH